MPNSKEEFLNAVKNGNLGEVRNFLEDKENKEMLTAQDQDGRTALHLAAERNYVDIAKYLLDAGAEIEAAMSDEGTPLQDAAAFGHDEMVQLLLIRGAKIEAANVDGWDALFFAVENGKLNTARILLERLPALANRKNANGVRAAHLLPAISSMSKKDSVALARSLKQHGAEMGCQDNVGDTPLHKAAEKGDLELAKELVRMTAKISVHNKNRETPAKVARRNEMDGIAEFLENKIIYRQQRVHTKFFDISRCPNPKTHALSKAFYEMRTSESNGGYNKKVGLKINGVSGRKFIMSEAGAVGRSLNGVDLKTLTTVQKIAEQTKWHNRGYAKSKKVNHHWNWEYLQYTLDSRELVICSQYQPQAGHLANFSMKGIGTYGPANGDNKTNVLEIIYGVTKTLPGVESDPAKEQAFAKMLIWALKVGTPITAGILKQWGFLATPPVGLDRLNRFFVLSGMKEVSRRMHSKYGNKGSLIEEELPIGLAHLQALYLISNGCLRVKDVFDKNAPFGIPTVDNLQASHVLTGAKQKLIKLNELFFTTFALSDDRETMHQLLLGSYGGASDSEGTPYKTSDDESKADGLPPPSVFSQASAAKISNAPTAMFSSPPNSYSSLASSTATKMEANRMYAAAPAMAGRSAPASETQSSASTSLKLEEKDSATVISTLSRLSLGENINPASQSSSLTPASFISTSQLRGEFGNRFPSKEEAAVSVSRFLNTEFLNQMLVAWQKSVIEVSASQAREKSLREQAEKYGFACKNVPKDGNCFFHAVAHQVSSLEGTYTHERLRALTTQHIIENISNYQEFADKKPDELIEEISKPGNWADHLFVQALSRAINVTFVIIRSDGNLPGVFRRPEPIAIVYLGYEVGVHYQSLTPTLRVGEEKREEGIDAIIQRSKTDDWTASETRSVLQSSTTAASNSSFRFSGSASSSSVGMFSISRSPLTTVAVPTGVSQADSSIASSSRIPPIASALRTSAIGISNNSESAASVSRGGVLSASSSSSASFSSASVRPI